uniref:Uncharacterized protein n=1 Tax=Zea mays TaxID=4577 RepID=A0A804QKG4_MAIZE
MRLLNGFDHSGMATSIGRHGLRMSSRRRNPPNMNLRCAAGAAPRCAPPVGDAAPAAASASASAASGRSGATGCPSFLAHRQAAPSVDDVTSSCSRELRLSRWLFSPSLSCSAAAGCCCCLRLLRRRSRRRTRVHKLFALGCLFSFRSLTAAIVLSSSLQ